MLRSITVSIFLATLLYWSTIYLSWLILAAREYGWYILAVLKRDYVLAPREYEVPLPCRDSSSGRFKWSSFRGRRPAHSSPALLGAFLVPA